MPSLVLIGALMGPACGSREADVPIATVYHPDYSAREEAPELYRFLYDFGWGDRTAEDIMSCLPYESISLSRTGIWDPNEVYSVTLNRDGTATYEGDAESPMTGEFTGTVDVWYYSTLCMLVESLQLDRMKPKYKAMATCLDTTTVRVRRERGDEIVVEDYGSQSPPAFRALGYAIDGVVARLEWTPVDTVGR